MSDIRILIAGIGNIFLGDDAFGVEVVKRIAGRMWAGNVRVVDFGIRGLDLTYALLDGYDAAILVDAVPRGQAPGTLYVIEPQPGSSGSALEEMQPGELLIETHGMDPVKVLRLVEALGGHLNTVLLVGCEPTPFDAEAEMQMELTPPVHAAIDEACTLIESLVARIQLGEFQSFGKSDSHSQSLKGDLEHVNFNAVR